MNRTNEAGGPRSGSGRERAFVAWLGRTQPLTNLDPGWSRTARGIYPEVQAIPVSRADRSGLQVRSGGELSGEDVVPGFRCPVAALFPAAGPAAIGTTVQEPTTP